MQALSLGEKVRKLRKGLDISMRELSRRAGVSSSFLSEIETGRRHPKADSLTKIAKALGVGVVDLGELDNRSSIEDLKRLLDRDPGWGAAFKRISSAAEDGSLTPSGLVKKLGPGK